MSDIVERLRQHCMFTDWQVSIKEAHEAADRIEQLEATLDTVRASGLLIGSTTLHDRVRSAVYSAIDANPAALEEAPCSSS